MLVSKSLLQRVSGGQSCAAKGRVKELNSESTQCLLVVGLGLLSGL